MLVTMISVVIYRHDAIPKILMKSAVKKFTCNFHKLVQVFAQI